MSEHKFITKYRVWWVIVMMFNATVINISAISWRSVLLMEERGVPRENHQPIASHWQTVSHNVVSSTHRHERNSNFSGDKALIAHGVVNPPIIRPRPRLSLECSINSSNTYIRLILLIYTEWFQFTSKLFNSLIIVL